MALTNCGEEVMVREDKSIIKVNVKARQLCDRCRPVIARQA